MPPPEWELPTSANVCWRALYWWRHHIPLGNWFYSSSDCCFGGFSCLDKYVQFRSVPHSIALHLSSAVGRTVVLRADVATPMMTFYIPSTPFLVCTCIIQFLLFTLFKFIMENIFRAPYKVHTSKHCTKGTVCWLWSTSLLPSLLTCRRMPCWS